MSAHTHTPGPWRHTMDRHMLPVVVAGPITVATVFVPPVGNAFSNAALLAAAPKLLEALTRLSNQASFLRLPGRPMTDAEKFAIEAISDATGEKE